MNTINDTYFVKTGASVGASAYDSGNINMASAFGLVVILDKTGGTTANELKVQTSDDESTWTDAVAVDIPGPDTNNGVYAIECIRPVKKYCKVVTKASTGFVGTITIFSTHRTLEPATADAQLKKQYALK